MYDHVIMAYVPYSVDRQSLELDRYREVLCEWTAAGRQNGV